ncbi:MAG: hypothetical protein A3F11_06770 [Gammaproteobacteria bacterium RIFCSPHIGHO2_12_FULL_37_14]|nr:MAG: hypothetical protein A3F11_06770 [Gammaproteobacteria bacterium RIFCSPHIGHO2_12_FULL_37_14]
MERFNFFLLLCTSIIAAVISGDIYAGNRAGAMTISFGEGYYYFASNRQIDNTGVPFLAFGYSLTDYWGIEGLVGVFNTPSRQADDNGQQVNGSLLAMDTIYHFKPYKNILEPFLLAGVGVLGLNPNGSDAHNQGNMNAGGGVQIFIHPSIAFRFDARDFYTFVGGKNDIFVDAGMSFLFF